MHKFWRQKFTNLVTNFDRQILFNKTLLFRVRKSLTGLPNYCKHFFGVNLVSLSVQSRTGPIAAPQKLELLINFLHVKFNLFSASQQSFVTGLFVTKKLGLV